MVRRLASHISASVELVRLVLSTVIDLSLELLAPTSRVHSCSVHVVIIYLHLLPRDDGSLVVNRVS